MSEPLLKIRGLKIEGRCRREHGTPSSTAVDLDVEKGEVLGLIGESGAGKSTIGLGLLWVTPVTAFGISEWVC